MGKNSKSAKIQYLFFALVPSVIFLIGVAGMIVNMFFGMNVFALIRNICMPIGGVW